MALKAPPFSDLVELRIEGDKITAVCTACGPPVVIHKDIKYANELVVAMEKHRKDYR